VNFVSILRGVPFTKKVFLRGEEIAKGWLDQSDLGEDQLEEEQVIDGFVSHSPSDLNEGILSVAEHSAGNEIKIKMQILKVVDFLFENLMVGCEGN
jgi:hypothetical protein